MKKLSILAILAIFGVACQKETEQPYTIDGPEIMAYQETGAGTKTLVEVNDGVGTIYWKPSEKINVFYGTTSTEYISKNKENATVAAFKTNDIIGATEEASTNIWGLYPYDEDAECNGSKVTTTIAATQYGVPETFDDNLFTTLAHSETRELRFYNVCGGIKFSLSRADITKITLKGNNNEPLAGKVDLTFSDGIPAATSVDAAATITLTPKTGSTFAKDVNYYIVTLPASMTGGFTMTFETETKIGTFNYTEKAVTVTRSKFGIKSNIDTYATFVDRGPVAVDLGLPSGTKWADVNLSGYYAWGETTTKSNYSWNNYSLGDGTAFTQVKYGYGEILLPEDDAATQAYGPNWKIPTREQWQELKNECTWILETDNKRYKVSSKVNSNYIYIPAEYHSNCHQEYKTTLIMFSYWQSDFYDALYHTGGLHEIIGSDEADVACAQTESCAYGVASGRSVRAVSGGIFPTDLSKTGTANCYIVPEAGTYKFKAVKGNSTTSVGDVKGVKVLWESFGTETTPSVEDLIKANVSYADNYITFSTNDTYKEGNAVIAAYSDAGCTDGNVLWSWHIWLTDQPEDQVYYNNAGTMMDRNLGATSAIPGNVQALGLLYQWGRKDPFLSGRNISDDTVAASSYTWPSTITSSVTTGTILYSIANPTTFIENGTDSDWIFAEEDQITAKRWTSYSEEKSIYDPCPLGWRIPDMDVWTTALGRTKDFDSNPIWDGINHGSNFSSKLGASSSIWYPCAGHYPWYATLYNVGGYSSYWTSTRFSSTSRRVFAFLHIDIFLTRSTSNSQGMSVRCIKE